MHKSKALFLKLFCIYSILLCLLVGYGCQNGEAPANKRARALEDLGNALVRDGKLREGLENYLEAYKLNSESPDLNHEIALCYRELGQYDDALKHFEKALVLRPQFPDAENNFGTLLLLMKKWDLAIEHFKKAISNVLYETPHFAYNNIGMVYYAKRDFKNAIANYQKALQSYPGFALCYKNMGMAYELDGNPKEAANSYQNAINNSTPEDPEFSLSHFLLGRLYLKMGKKKEAKDLLQKAIEIDPKAPFVEEAKKLLNSIKP